METYPHLNGKRILVVDDEPDILDTIEDILSMCTITKASGFEEAKAVLETTALDLALLDIMGVDGYELLAIAKAHGIPSVMLTARALTVDDVKKSYVEGASFYIPKEELAHIDAFLNEIFEDIAAGNNPWRRWMKKMGGFCERTFGKKWQQKDPDFWDNIPFY
ncbi:response regulator [Desulfatirhabdium butyrativorans]|uniref:response regulator n=1 Tax=Desulfatirhabdium butyrativorans TaxID=340467 RepID=UPI000409CDFC|nr:response regulator [Desulfatirhabdium butyrativorans]